MANDNFAQILAGVPPGIINARAYVPGMPIEELRRVRGLDPATEIVKLASNENPLGPSPKAMAAMREAIPGLHIYPDASGFKLKSRLAQILGVKLDQIVLGNGSENILDMLARAFLNPGDEVVLSQHCFPQFTLVATLVGAKIRFAPVNSDLSQSVNSLIDAISPQTRLLIVGHPDNPTGSILGGDDLFEVAAALPPQAIMVVDEAYHGLVTGTEYISSLDSIKRLNDGHRPIITSRTFSKAYGLAGVRIAYAVMPVVLREIVEKVRLPFNVNAVAQAGALAALDDEEYLKRSFGLIATERPRMVKRCEKLGLKAIDGNANFFLLDCTPNTGKEISDALLEQLVIVRPLMHPELSRFCRVSVGLPKENDQFLLALERSI